MMYGAVRKFCQVLFTWKVVVAIFLSFIHLLLSVFHATHSAGCNEVAGLKKFCRHHEIEI